MAINFDGLLTIEEREAILDRRIKTWAVDAFGHSLNRDAALDINPDADTEAVDKQLAALESAISWASRALVAGGAPPATPVGVEVI